MEAPVRVCGKPFPENASKQQVLYRFISARLGLLSGGLAWLAGLFAVS
jgi:hypothetical protein